MSIRARVPAHVEADSILDLVQDCRQISGVAGPPVPAARVTDTRGTLPVEIGA